MPRGAKPKLYYNPEMSTHTHPWAHVEKRTRASDVYEHLDRAGLLGSVQVLPGHSASDEELRTVHTQRHIDEVGRMTAAARADPTNRELCEPDGPGGVYYSGHADAAARLACGCVIDAAVGVLQDSKNATATRASPGDKARRRAPPAFAIVRPPGHHAGADPTDGHHAEGFCFYNSVAVAAGVVLASGDAKKVAILDWDVRHGKVAILDWDVHHGKVAILDWDVHHGERWYPETGAASGGERWYPETGAASGGERRAVASGGERWYPETGAACETGGGGGQGRNLNVPWTSDGLADSDYLAAFRLVLCPVLAQFSPDLLLLSAGFDAADGDAQGKMKVTAAGYNSRVTCECCEAVLRVLLGSSPPATSPTLLAPSVEPTLRSVLAHNAPHWSGLRYSEKAVQDFFAEAARVGSAPRVSKRQRTAPAFADEERANPRAAEQQKLAEKRAAREAARGAAEEERAESAAALARAEREVKAARRRCREAEEGLQVYRDDVGQWADVKYDDGDEERRRPALEDSSSDEEEEEEEEEGGQEEEEEGEEPMQESSAEM
ncbi:hypothetical protein EMIHUDRAFT_118559 [Emiliania huxleyi CCMP1516]|uniref:histone deacetylase n=2 Tax=Emiliania huxleyi TaxID=2903 RepID=A0A0D3J1Y4_EMIH1|nr:hypothetical protein EMIHUDRAFT_118559 [Emiliania huxleyi CCMP1516]EOD17519.1 hypothetical protein EMIHUDRAFT_118559 [Emiliania huxleyi CCMP1516]|eukprot:XP_005769948.1 hypothetical protein EMIHUDRAFT_118559 [Emiliania huxleyi CCMP1516]